MLRQFHLQKQPIPDGFQIYENYLYVKGVQHYRRAATAFAKASKRRLELEREPYNIHDKNAVKVIACYEGLFGAQRKCIGYVPRGVAAAIVRFGLDRVLPRLSKTFVGDDGFVEIEFQILGPKRSRKKEKNKNLRWPLDRFCQSSLEDGIAHGLPADPIGGHYYVAPYDLDQFVAAAEKHQDGPVSRGQIAIADRFHIQLPKRITTHRQCYELLMRYQTARRFVYSVVRSLRRKHNWHRYSDSNLSERSIAKLAARIMKDRSMFACIPDANINNESGVEPNTQGGEIVLNCDSWIRVDKRVKGTPAYNLVANSGLA